MAPLKNFKSIQEHIHIYFETEPWFKPIGFIFMTISFILILYQLYQTIKFLKNTKSIPEVGTQPKHLVTINMFVGILYMVNVITPFAGIFQNESSWNWVYHFYQVITVIPIWVNRFYMLRFRRAQVQLKASKETIETIMR